MTRYSQLAPGMIATISLLLAGCQVSHREVAATQREVLPRREPAFTGMISRDAGKTRGAYPPEVTAGKVASNGVEIRVDDVGFSTTTPFGGVIEPPNVVRLGASG